MGASNFARHNASKTFVIFENEDDIRLEEEYIQSRVKELLSEVTLIEEFDRTCNSYISRIFGRITVYKDILDFKTCVTINLKWTYGYYGAANLDWDVKYGDNDSDDIEDEIYWFNRLSNANEGLKTIHSKHLRNWLGKIALDNVKAVEKVYSQISRPYQKIGTFSNGETIYEKL